jgi:transcriptional regulator with XRE-family HTH domain
MERQMAKRKVRPHPGTLAELLKRKEMTQTDAASASGIDRKTLSKIDRGEEVKLETLQKLAEKLNVPATHFEPPADNSISPAESKPDDPLRLNLMLRKIDAARLTEMLLASERINWQLNVHTIDDETVQLLEQLEDAVKDLDVHLSYPYFLDPEEDGSLRVQLAGLKKSKHVASLLEELAKRSIAILGAEYLSWQSNKQTTWHNEIEYTHIAYVSTRNVVLSVEGHPAQARRAAVWQGTEPPKVAPDQYTIIKVNGTHLDADIPF